ncbi:hypothetical protein BI347_10105 [Chromobacterium sphagni]|uniref:Glycosyl transferase n=2 Tax=Chromobacterium sphagni TaxID=1903179 RepID=A0A1S1X345_9NEIS|nr:hypothetical protein BI347_10105 [Chromobacterium sphagni]OHX20831.1 hypothetical protein BI344_13980 [Chromobacterium sphagni]
MRQCAGASESNPHIDKQIVIDMVPSGNHLKDALTLQRLWWRLLIGSYDIAVILHRNALFQLLCKAAAIGKLVGFTAPRFNLLQHAQAFSMQGNRTLQEARLLRQAGLIDRMPDRLEFHPAPEKVDERKFAGLPRDYIAINPGGGNPHAPADNKIWPAGNYIQLIKELDRPVVLLGSGDKDKEICEVIAGACGQQTINLVNRLNLHEAAQAIRQSRLYIGNDSALLYIAAALRVPLIGLYGPTPADAFLPLGGPWHQLSGKTGCSPCYSSLEGARSPMYSCLNNICMQAISTEQVLAKTRLILTSGKLA